MRGEFFIADPHFGCEAIIRYENRPFTSARQMNLQMVKLWKTTSLHQSSCHGIFSML